MAASYDTFARLRVILLNENAVVYDYCPKSGHCTRNGRASLFASKNDTILKNITELVLGSVALNYGQHLPVTKVHQLSDRLTATSLVFGHVPATTTCVSPLPTLASSPTPSSCSSRNGSRSPVPLKYGLTVLWETPPAERELIEQFIRKEGHLLDCFMTVLKDAMLEGVALRSPSALNDATRSFLVSVQSALSANYLSNNVSLEMYARELLALVRKSDLKSNNFFVTRLLSTTLAYCDRKQPDTNVGKQIIITTTEQDRRPLLERLLIVLSYFIGDSLPLKRDLGDVPDAAITLPEPFCPQFDFEFAASLPNVVEQAASTYTISTNNSSDDLVKLRRRENDAPSSSSRSVAETKVAMEPQPLQNAIPKRLASEGTKSGPNSTSGRKSRDESLGYGSLSDSGSSNELMTTDENVDTMDARLMEELASKLTAVDYDQVDGDMSSLRPLLEYEPSTSQCCEQQICVPEPTGLAYDDDVVFAKIPNCEPAISREDQEVATMIENMNKIDLNASNGSLDQSKLYMREYLSLRFHSPPCVGHDRTCFTFEEPSGCEGDVDTPMSTETEVSSLRSRKSESKRDSMFAIFNEKEEDDADELRGEVRPSRSMPGFLEMDMPSAAASLSRSAGSQLDWQPMHLRATLNEDRILAHGQLQAVFLRSKRVTITDLTREVACECYRRTNSVLHVDLDNW